MKLNGYYLSEPIPYEDYHGGVKIEHTNYVAYYFEDLEKVYIDAKTNEHYFTKNDFLKNGYKVDYIESNNTLEFILDKGSEFEARKSFKKHENNTFFNKKLVKFTWTPFPGEDEDKQSPADKIDS